MKKNQSSFAYHLAPSFCFATTVACMNRGMNVSLSFSGGSSVVKNIDVNVKSMFGQPPMGNEGNNGVQLHGHGRRKTDHMGVAITLACVAVFVLLAFALGELLNRCSRNRPAPGGVNTAFGQHEPVDGINAPPVGEHDIELAQESTRASTTSQTGTSLTKRMMLHTQRRAFSRNAKAQESHHEPDFVKCASKTLEPAPTPEVMTSHPCYFFFEPAYKLVITHLNKAGELEKIVKFLGSHSHQSHYTFQDAQAALKSYPMNPAILKGATGLLVENAKPGLFECLKKQQKNMHVTFLSHQIDSMTL